MESLINKLSEYNILNNLLPGVVVIQFIKLIFGINLIDGDVITVFFMYYFAGVVASRVGSLVIEEFLKKSKLLQKAKYKDYIIAEKKDGLIKTLNCSANNYRSLSSVFFIIIMLMLMSSIFKVNVKPIYYLVIFLLFLLLTLSYIKQARYITARIEIILKNSAVE